MRLILPTITSQKIKFSQRFQNLNYVLGSNGQVSGSISVNKGLDLSGGGFVKYGSYGAGTVWNMSVWSIYLRVDVPAAGSARTLVTCGDAVLGDVFEAGSGDYEFGGIVHYLGEIMIDEAIALNLVEE